MSGGISFEGRALPDDNRPFGIIINTAPDEFLIVGSNLSTKFSIESPEVKKVAIGSIDEGVYVKGIWKPGRRINGDEVYSSMPKGKLLIQKIKVFQYN